MAANIRLIGSLLLLGALALGGCAKKSSGSSVPGRQPGQASWYGQYRAPTSSNLRAVRAASSVSVLVAGDATTILRSDNGGQGWAQLEHQPASRGGDVVSVDFLGSHLECVGIDSGDTTKGRVWKAINGVLDFTTPDLNATVPPYVGVDVVSSDTSYRLRTDGVLEKDVDGVVTTFLPALPAGTWTAIHFTGTADNGFAVGDTYKIYKMTNGVWSATPMTAPVTNTHTLRKVTFPTSMIGYACGDNISILKTIDGGLTWTQQIPNPPTFATPDAFHSIHFPVNGNVGWVVGDGGLIANTTDGGGTWNTQVAPTVEDLYDVWFTDNSNGYAVGDNGIVLRTKDGGSGTNGGWQRVPTLGAADVPVQLNAVDFTSNGTIGLAVGNGGAILRTLNGGNSWLAQSNPALVDLFGVSIPHTGSGDVAYACGAGGTVVRTTNLRSSSPTWTAFTPGGANTLRAILFPTGDDVGYLCGDASTLLHTTNGTNASPTWSVPVTPPAPAATNWLSLSSNLTGLSVYVAGTGGISSVSGDLGITWSNLTAIAGTPTINSFQSPPGAGTLFAGAADGNVWRNITTVWFSTTPPAGIPQSMSFADSNNGWIVSSPAPFTGGVFFTPDGGTTWSHLYVHTKSQLRGIWMSPSVPGRGYVVGDNGTILKTLSGGQ